MYEQRARHKLHGQCVVDARRRWNRTGIHLEAGKRYDFEAAPGETWHDAAIACGPEGYESGRLRRFERWRRIPYANWFVLIGALDGDTATAFPIGSGKENYIPLRSGELCCFAKDVWFMSWNNRGRIGLTVYERSA